MISMALPIHAGAGSFYAIYGIALVIFLLLATLIGGGTYVLMRDSFTDMPQEAIIGLIAIAYVMLIIISLLIVPYFMARIQNLVWNNTALGEHRFSSDMTVLGMAWIIFSNFFLIIVTLGLFKPFADIRLARYRIEHLSLLPAGNIEEFIASEAQQVGATGTETAEIFDVDIGF